MTCAVAPCTGYKFMILACNWTQGYIIFLLEKRTGVCSIPIFGYSTSIKGFLECWTGTSWSLWMIDGFIWSDPEALWWFRSLKSFNIPFRKTVMNRTKDLSLDIWDGRSFPLSTKSCIVMRESWLSLSGGLDVKTDWNRWFRMLALSVAFVYINHLVLVVLSPYSPF